MRLTLATIGALLLIGCSTVAGPSDAAALETGRPKHDGAACFSLRSLIQSLPNYGRGLSVTHLIGGSQAKLWAAEVVRKTGSSFSADQVATVEGTAIAPLVMLIFASQGCADNLVMIHLVPDAAI